MLTYNEFGFKFMIDATCCLDPVPDALAYCATRDRAKDNCFDLDFETRSIRETSSRMQAALIISSSVCGVFPDETVAPTRDADLLVTATGCSLNREVRRTANRKSSYSPKTNRETVVSVSSIAPISS